MSDVDAAFLILERLNDAQVEYIVVGGMAAVLLGAPIVTADVDIVHRRSPENVQRLLQVLRDLDAHARMDLAGRKLAPSEGHLTGHGHINLKTELGPLDVLCEVGDNLGYEELMGDTERVLVGTLELRVLSLPKLIEVKTVANRPKDRWAIPILIATHQKRSQEKPGGGAE
jgi:hypothetical protein